MRPHWPQLCGGAKNVKRHIAIGLLAVVAVGLSWVAVSPSASAKGASTTIHSMVGKTVIRGVGSNATFAVASCTSSAPIAVPCTVWSTAPPHDSVRLWCLAPGSATLTVAYKPNPPQPAEPSTTLSVTCKGARTSNVSTPGYKVANILNSSAPKYSVRSCSTNVLGTACSFNGEAITKACTLAASLNTLPVTVTATVTLNGDPVIQGKQIVEHFNCN